ncbi:MAG: hypothetical protein ACOX6V_02245 [Patescibacteria group bacterium]
MYNPSTAFKAEDVEAILTVLWRAEMSRKQEFVKLVSKLERQIDSLSQSMDGKSTIQQLGIQEEINGLRSQQHELRRKIRRIKEREQQPEAAG